MIKIIENSENIVIFKKETREESWFNHNCSDENLKKQCNREKDNITRVQFMDGDYIGSELMVYFDGKNTSKEYKLVKFEKFNITGRGIVFAIDKQENNIQNINIGDVVIDDDEIKWVVSNIEKNNVDNKLGLIVKLKDN